MPLQDGYGACLVRYDYTVVAGLAGQDWLIVLAYLGLGLFGGYLIGHFVGERCAN